MFSFDKDRKIIDIHNADTWEEHLQSFNNLFEEILKNDKNYKMFCDKMFFVWECNHRVTTWYRHIDRLYEKNAE